jgi:hypothetical protein
MCGVMAAAALVALVGLRSGRQDLVSEPEASLTDAGHTSS